MELTDLPPPWASRMKFGSKMENQTQRRGIKQRAGPVAMAVLGWARVEAPAKPIDDEEDLGGQVGITELSDSDEDDPASSSLRVQAK